MKQTPINNKWGTIVEFDNPLDVFKQTPGYWRDMIYDRQLIVFKRMKFTKANYVKLCASFGRLWSERNYQYSHEKTESVMVNNFKFVISPISNKISGRLGMNEMKWHSDIPNKTDKPFPMRSIWMVKNPHPDSGLTSWLNIEHGIDCLPTELKEQIPNIKIMQQSWWKKDTDIQEHDFIKIHPITNQPSLRLNFFCDSEKNINDAWIRSVKVNGEEQIPKPVLGPYLNNLEQQKELIYTHKWDEFDIIIYDNWPFVHNRTKLEFDSELERLMYRTNIDHLTETEYVVQSNFVSTLPIKADIVTANHENKNYIPFYIKNFEQIQQSLQELYKDKYSGTSVQAFPKEWNRENFLELYDIVEKFFKNNNSTIVSCRFFYTPAGKTLGTHIDGEGYNTDFWALNIPIFASKYMHWQEWFDYDGELKTDSDGVYINYVQPANPEKLSMIDRLVLNSPHVVRVGKFHRVVNDSTENRLIVSIRFDTKSLNQLLTRIAETASNVSPNP